MKSVKKVKKELTTFDFIEYIAYARNRTKYPEFEVSLYKHLFENWEMFEEKFSQERERWQKIILKESYEY